MAHSVRQVN